MSFSGTGDPNYYIARGRTPTLTDADLKDTRIGAASTLTPASVIPGLYVLGIRAYCCQDATVAITLSTAGVNKCGNGVVESGEACERLVYVCMCLCVCVCHMYVFSVRRVSTLG